MKKKTDLVYRTKATTYLIDNFNCFLPLYLFCRLLFYLLFVQKGLKVIKKIIEKYGPIITFALYVFYLYTPNNVIEVGK